MVVFWDNKKVNNMDMIKDITKWTTTKTGQIIIGVSVLGLGLGHFGYGMGLENMLGGKVGMVMGAVGVLVGLSTLKEQL
jgi:hypothetical protein